MGFREKIAYRLLGVKSTHRVTICKSVPESILEGKRVLVTGGSSGIGLAVARACLSSGASIAVTGRNEAKLDSARRSLGSKALMQQWDHSDLDAIVPGLDETCKLLGNLPNCAFLNAGIYVTGEYAWGRDAVHEMFDVNLISTCMVARELIKRWRSNNVAGTIVITGSNRGMFPDASPYGMAKASLHSFVQGIARDYALSGIRANAVAPGMTASDINGVSPDGDLARFDRKSYRVIRPEEIAEVAVFLLSERSSCINGAVIPCDLGDYLR